MIFAVIILFAFVLLANRGGEAGSKVIENIVAFMVAVVFTGEFIKRLEMKQKSMFGILKRSEEKYKLLYRFGKIMADTSPDLFWAKDINGNYLYANKAMRNKFLNSVELNNLIGKNDSFFAEKDDNGILSEETNSISDFDEEVIRNESSRKFERSILINGETFIFDFYKAPLYDSSGKSIGIMGTGRDVTKEKEEEQKREKAEYELRANEKKFRELIENLNEIVFTSDATGKVTYINDSFEKLTGFSKDILNEIKPRELIHPDDYEHFMNAVEKVKQNKKVENLEYRAKTALGNYLHFLTTIQPVKFENGTFAGLTGIATDITKIKKAENEIVSSKNNLDTILSAIPDLLLIFDTEGNYLDIFPNDSNYLIVPFSESRGKNLAEILPESVAEEFMTIINKAVATNHLINYKYSLPINGKNVLFNARVRKINYAGKTAVLWDAHDITAEDKIMKALQENEKRFLNLLNYTYDWEYWVKPNGEIGFTSPSCVHQTGYEPEEFFENPDLLIDIVHPEDKQNFLDHLEKVKNSNSYGKIQFKILKKNGEMRVIRHTCQAVFDNGIYIGRRVTNRNETDRWKAEQKSKKNEQKYMSIFNSLIDVYYRLNIDGIVQNISPSVEKISGYKPDEVIGKDASSFYLFPEMRKKLFEKTINEGEIQNFEIDLKDKSGKIKTVSFNNRIVYDNKGKPIGIEGMLRDVSEIKKAREELIKAKNEIQNYLSIVRVMILVLDTDGNIKLINRKGCKILGYEENELIGKNWFDNFIPESQKDRVLHIFNLMINGKYERVKTNENEIINKDGNLITIKWNNSYLENSKGEIIGMLSSGEDITREKEMLRELQESEKNLRELNAAKDKFFSIVSHDIRSPFTALLGFTQILDEDIDQLTNEEIVEIVHGLRRTSNNIFKFIEGLLEWSRVQSNKIEINPVIVKLHSLVQGVFVLFSTVAEKKNVQIFIDIQENLEVITDENIAETVLRNLVSNAIKFTNSGDLISIYTEDSEKEITVCVKDTGVGMLEEIKNKLFRLDKHVSEVGTNRETGTGLGLLLCRDLLEKQNNKIWVESKPNVGSTFKFTLKKHAVKI